MKLAVAQIEATLSVVFPSSLGNEHCKRDRKILEFCGLREHLISSQFFSKRNAFQIGFTPLPPLLSERLIAHFLTIIDVVFPQDLVYPRRNFSQRVSCPSPQEKLQPTTSSPLLPRFLTSSPSQALSTHRLLCAWPPSAADRDCRQRKHLQTSHNGWMENGMDPQFLTTGFPKRFSCRDIVDPIAQRKKFSPAICLCLVRTRVCARYMYCI